MRKKNESCYKLKNIWYISKYFNPETASSNGGRDWMLMKHLAMLGIEPTVITSDSNNLVSLPELNDKVTVEDKQGVKIFWLKTLKYQVAKSSKRILSWLHFEFNLFRLNKSDLPKPDVVIVSSLSLLTVINGLLLKRKFKCKLIFEVRDIWPLTIIEEGGFKSWNPFVVSLRIIEKLGYKYADAIVGTMPNLKAHVKESLGYDRPVFCIPMGLDSKVLENDVRISDSYVNKYLDSACFKVVHAGTIGITNALDTFFEAAKALQDNKKIQFIVVGDGALKEQYIQEYGNLPNLVFAPKVPKNQVQSVLSHADVLYFSVFKSKVWDYGQSLNKVIDYMLSGKPVVASYSGYPSMINEARCGTFIPAEDVNALIKEIHNYQTKSEIERIDIGKRGKEWLINHRSYAKLAKDYYEILNCG